MIADSDRFLVVHGADPAEWALRYDIEPFSKTCRHCGREISTTLPIAQGTFRGLMAPPCPCGSRSKTYCLVRSTASEPLFG